MSAGTELERTDEGALTPAQIEELEAQAAGQKRDQLRDERVGVPILSVVQGTSKNPPEGAKNGDFYNALTGDVFGADIDLLVVTYHRGRFFVEKDANGKRTGRTFAAGTDPVVPQFWPDQFKGRVFAELPEAEERYAEMANDGQIEWGSGPPIQTTYNFTGFVVRPELEDAEPFPVRLPVKSTSAKAGKAIIRALAPLRNYWQRSVRLTTDRKTNAAGEPFYAVEFEGFADAPSDYYRAAALELYAVANQVGIREVGGDADAPAATPPGDGPAEEPKAGDPNF